MKDSDKKKVERIKRYLEQIKTSGVIVDDDIVIIDRKVWDEGQRQYRGRREAEKAIYGGN